MLLFSQTISSYMMSKRFAENIIDFNRNLHFTGKLPKGYQVLNPFRDNPETTIIMK